MKSLSLFIFLSTSFVFFGQNKSIFIGSYFKDKLLDNSKPNQYSGSALLPIFENEFDINKINRDSSVQYYQFAEILFKKHLFEIIDSNCQINISPIFNFSTGKDFSDTNDRKLFQNTRGIYIEGDLKDKFSFNGAIFENQGRFSPYEDKYYRTIGELYPNQSAGIYTTQNAVIPGSARTKPFKEDGFDYAYSMGSISYRINNKLTLNAGNTPQFIGEGYRSILLSDNSAPAPFFLIRSHFSKKWHFQYLRKRLINLMRKPTSSSVEAYYETKAFSVNYLSYQPNKKWNLSMFEGIIWSKGDSVQSYRVNGLFYNPIPIFSALFLSKDEIYPVYGTQISFLPLLGNRLYHQFALDVFNPKEFALQLGYRSYNFLGLKNLMLQVEYNYVSKNMYSSENPRLNFTHYNLPLAIVKGNSFHEGILRLNYEWKRIYIDSKSIFYQLKDHRTASLLSVKKEQTPLDGNLIHQNIEIGYRFNKKMNFCLFLSYTYRKDQSNLKQQNNLFNLGIKTNINNIYNDF